MKKIEIIEIEKGELTCRTEGFNAFELIGIFTVFKERTKESLMKPKKPSRKVEVKK